MKKEIVTLTLLTFCVTLFYVGVWIDSDIIAYRLVGVAIGAACTAGVWRVYVDFRKCRHPGLFEKKWITEEGVPMIRQWCPACNFLRYGPEDES